jgi:hypothetical protein
MERPTMTYLDQARIAYGPRWIIRADSGFVFPCRAHDVPCGYVASRDSVPTLGRGAYATEAEAREMLAKLKAKHAAAHGQRSAHSCNWRVYQVGLPKVAA